MKKPLYLLFICASLMICSQAKAQDHESPPMGEELAMSTYTVIQKPTMMVIGITCRTSNAPEAGPIDIANLWGQFYSEEILKKIPNQASPEIIALYCDYEGDFTQPYSVVIGCAVSSTDDIPEGMVAKILPESRYALFHAVGDFPKSLIDTWGKIWQTSLNRTYTGDFEVYGQKFISSPQEVEIYIAVEEE